MRNVSISLIRYRLIGMRNIPVSLIRYRLVGMQYIPVSLIRYHLVGMQYIPISFTTYRLSDMQYISATFIMYHLIGMRCLYHKRLPIAAYHLADTHTRCQKIPARWYACVVHPGRGISGKGYQLKGSRSVGYRLGDTFIDIKEKGCRLGII